MSSSPGTIIHQWGRRVLNCRKPDISPGRQRNAAILRTLGPWVVLLLVFLSVKVGDAGLVLDPVLLAMGIVILAFIYIYPRLPD